MSYRDNRWGAPPRDEPRYGGPASRGEGRFEGSGGASEAPRRRSRSRERREDDRGEWRYGSAASGDRAPAPERGWRGAPGGPLPRGLASSAAPTSVQPPPPRGPAPAATKEEDEEPLLDDDGLLEAEDEETKAARLLEESRARRAALLAKHKSDAPAAPDAPAPATSPSVPIAPAGAFDVLTSNEQLELPKAVLAVTASPQQQGGGRPSLTGPASPPGFTARAAAAGAGASPALFSPAPEVSMFDSELDDEEWTRRAAVSAARKHGGPGVAAPAAAAATTNAFEADDAEGYYRAAIGEMLGGRYRVLGTRGKGVFSTVLYCEDTQAAGAEGSGGSSATTGTGNYEAVISEVAGRDSVTTAEAPLTLGTSGVLVRSHAALAAGSSRYVAVKLIRSNDTMRRAGASELDLLRAIATADPSGRYHVVRLLHTFDHLSHLCLVFEPLALNLKEVQVKFGKGVGISIAAVQAYAKQLALALALLHKLGIIHADIKPHNILASEGYNTIKLADFGSAFREDDPSNEPTPLLVSRFYRAPEVILGFKHTTALDTWAAACCLFELFTGSPLFPGDTNNDMLWRMQRLRGRFPHRMLRAHLRQCESYGIECHFEPDLRFKHATVDPVTKAPVTKAVDVPDAPVEDLKAALLARREDGDDRRAVLSLADLLERMLTLDASKRATIHEVLQHPFISSKRA